MNEIKNLEVMTMGRKFYILQEGIEVARAYLYVLNNDLHDRPFGFIEDVFVQSPSRGNGLGSSLIGRIIEEARERGCYKLICCSKHGNNRTHNWYLEFGFKDNGKEFRWIFSDIYEGKTNSNNIWSRKYRERFFRFRAL